MTPKQAAEALARKGFKVFPIKAGAKAPPLWRDWPRLATAQVNGQWPESANVGIHCEGLLVLDVDVHKGGRESLKDLDMIEGIPTTLTARTPSGGLHLFYRLPVGHPGVTNSVQALGAGLDIRSTGGYVVGVGSTVPAGEYVWANDAPLNPAPEWLVQKLALYTPREQREEMDIPDAGKVALERAQAWLAARPGAVEGEGGDAYTFATAAFLRDFGLSVGQTLELMMEWNEKCSPPWGVGALEAKVRNAYRYAAGEPGAKAITPADFPVLEDEEPRLVATNRPPRKALRLGELAREADENRYLIKGWLQMSSYASLYGPPGIGKTFMALDWGYHVAAGHHWHGAKTRQGVVLYLAYEGTGGLVKRAKALRQRYGDEDVPLYVAAADFNLSTPEGRHAVRDLMATLPEKPSLIVIDTFARALMGGDENSAKDVGAFNDTITRLIEYTGACVLLLHHTGKDKTKGARGSSSLLAALDTEIQIDPGLIVATKQRNVEIGEPEGFKLVPVVVGIDEDGDEITSCCVAEHPISELSPGNTRMTETEQWVLEVLEELSPDNEPVSREDLQAACERLFRASARTTRRAEKALLARHAIESTNGMIKRTIW